MPKVTVTLTLLNALPLPSVNLITRYLFTLYVAVTALAVILAGFLATVIVLNIGSTLEFGTLSSTMYVPGSKLTVHPSPLNADN